MDGQHSQQWRHALTHAHPLSHRQQHLQTAAALQAQSAEHEQLRVNDNRNKLLQVRERVALLT